MRGKDLLECMEYIDDALVEEALEPTAFPCRNNIIAKWSMAAACVVVLGISATAFWSHQNIREDHTESAGEDMASPAAMNTAAAGEGGNAQNLQESTQAETSITKDVQTDGMTVDEGVKSGAATAGKTDTAMQDADSGKDSATAVTELRDGLLTKEAAEEEVKKFSYTVISGYYGEKDDLVYDYPVPKKGEFFCYHYLQETMEYYAEQEKAVQTADSPIYAYDVVIDLYGDIEIEGGKDVEYGDLSEYISTGSEMIEQEYRRLIELGYAVRLSEDFQLTGTFTKVELDTFQALPEYGYTFRFADED